MKKIYLLFFVLPICFFILVNDAQAAATSSNYDLTVVDITVNPPSPSVNRLVSITIKVKNNGKYPAISGRGYDSYYYIFPDFNKEKAVYPSIGGENTIAPGGTVDYYYEGRFNKTGAKDLLFTIDHSNSVEESNENNNTLSKTIKVNNFSDLDLSVDAFSIDKTRPIIGESVKLIYTIKNLSDVSLTASTGLMFENDFTADPMIFKDIVYDFTDFKLDKFTYDTYPTFAKPLNKNGIIKYTYQGYFAKSGKKDLSFSMNKNFILTETNQKNNSTSTSIIVFATTTDRDDFDITPVVVKSLSSTSVMASWQTNRPTMGQVDYRLNSYTNYTNKEADTSTTTHNIILKNLLPNTIYNYRAWSSFEAITKIAGESVFMTRANDKQIVNTDTVKNSANATSTKIENKSSKIIDEPIRIKDKNVYLKWKGRVINYNNSFYYIGFYKQFLYNLGSKLQINQLQKNEFIGIKNKDIEKISIGITKNNKKDTDSDELSDELEQALGTNVNKSDTDNDGFKDAIEIRNNFSPLKKNVKKTIDKKISGRLAGQFIVQIENKGRIWYVSPANKKRYYLANISLDSQGVSEQIKEKDFLNLIK